MDLICEDIFLDVSGEDGEDFENFEDLDDLPLDLGLPKAMETTPLSANQLWHKFVHEPIHIDYPRWLIATCKVILGMYARRQLPLPIKLILQILDDATTIIRLFNEFPLEQLLMTINLRFPTIVDIEIDQSHIVLLMKEGARVSSTDLFGTDYGKIQCLGNFNSTPMLTTPRDKFLPIISVLKMSPRVAKVLNLIPAKTLRMIYLATMKTAMPRTPVKPLKIMSNKTFKKLFEDPNYLMTLRNWKNKQTLPYRLWETLIFSFPPTSNSPKSTVGFALDAGRRHLETFATSKDWTPLALWKAIVTTFNTLISTFHMTKEFVHRLWEDALDAAKHGQLMLIEEGRLDMGHDHTYFKTRNMMTVGLRLNKHVLQNMIARMTHKVLGSTRRIVLHHGIQQAMPKIFLFPTTTHTNPQNDENFVCLHQGIQIEKLFAPPPKLRLVIKNTKKPKKRKQPTKTTKAKKAKNQPKKPNQPTKPTKKNKP